MLVRKLGQIVTKRVLKFLDEKAKKEPKKYNAWFSNLGFFSRRACAPSTRTNKSSPSCFGTNRAYETGELTSFREYVARMPEAQDKCITSLLRAGNRRRRHHI